MKKTALMFTVLLLGTYIFANDQPFAFAPDKFADDTYTIYVLDWLEQVEPEYKKSQYYDYALRDKGEKYEVRYTLFKQIEKQDDMRKQAAIWANLVTMSIGGSKESVRSTKDYEDSEVQKEFNADFGFSAILSSETTDFTNEFDFIMVNFFYKENLGIMCQTILFNDADIFKSEEFFKAFHSFRFK